MKTIGRSEAFFGNSDQQISADCDPDLRHDRVSGSTEKCLDSQVLEFELNKQGAITVTCVRNADQNPFRCDIIVAINKKFING